MKYLAELKKLRFPADQYAVFGSGPIAIRGLRESNDIDIIVKPALWNKLCRKYPVEKINHTEVIKLEKIEIFKDWKPWFEDTNALIDEAEIINGVRFARLEKVLIWKRAMGREKDKADIKLMEGYLKQ